MSCLMALSAMAQEKGTINGINYSWSNGRATVEKQSKSIMNLTANINESITDYADGGKVYIVDSIVDGAFSESNLMYLTMPKTIKKISRSCFSGCKQLQNAHIPDNVISLGNKSFYGCKNLRNINFPSSIETLEDSCFADSYYYDDIKLEKNVKEIGKACFANCKYIPSVKIYGRIDSLNDRTFYGCSKLTTFKWPQNVIFVGRGCFAGCSSLEEIHLPYTIEVLSDSCFANCTNLSKIYCLWKDLDKIVVSDDAFKNISTSTILFVPKGYINVYRNKSPWNKFSIIEEYESTDVSKVESIDLGLSVKWATCNVGVSSPSEYGDKLAWGELFPKDYYSWGTYDYCKNGNWYGGIINIGSDISKTEYDVAHEVWGENWRMPTYEETEELINNCNWEWIDKDGTSGMKITGYNGNSIFLPSNDFNSLSGSYWTSTEGGYSHSAIALTFDNLNNISLGGSCNKYLGMFVRPVATQDAQTNYLSIEVHGSGQVAFGKVDIRNCKKYFNVDKHYNSVLYFHPNANERVQKLFVNEKDVTESIIDGYYVLHNNSDSTFVRVEFSNSVAPSDAIDLGLSVLWSNCNLGAETPEEKGKSFAWGTIQSVNDWNDYICSEHECGGPYDPVYAAGLFEIKDIAGSEFDQAHVLLGSGWQLPSNEQFQELIDKCEWNRASINGTNGFRITGINGNSIFLPDNGYGKPGGIGYYDYNGGGYYWTSSVDTEINGGTLHFEAPNSKYITSNVRCYTQYIRPIFKQTGPNTGISEKNPDVIEKGDTVYFKLNGTKVNKPTTGIYIVKTLEGKYSKIIKKVGN